MSAVVLGYALFILGLLTGIVLTGSIALSSSLTPPLFYSRGTLANTGEMAGLFYFRCLCFSRSSQTARYSIGVGGLL